MLRDRTEERGFVTIYHTPTGLNKASLRRETIDLYTF